MYQNSTANVSPDVLEARCSAAYRQSGHPQYRVMALTFGYPYRFGRTGGRGRTRMSAVDMTDPALEWNARPQFTLECRLNALQRVHLQPY